MLTNRQKNLWRSFYKTAYPAVRIRADGTIEAKKSVDSPFGILLSPDNAKAAAETLEARYIASKKGSYDHGQAS